MQILLLLFLLISPLFALSQQRRIDSLKKVVSEYSQKDSVYAFNLAELGWTLRNSNINEAFEYNRKAILLATELKLYHLLAKISNHRGVLYRNIGDYPEAERKFYEALNFAQKYNVLLEEAYAYNNLGDLARITGNPLESIKLIEKAKDIFIKIKDKRGEAYTYIRMSEAYQKLKDYKKSYEFAEKSLKIREQLGHLQDMGASLNRIGDILAIQERYKEALEYYQRAVTLAVNANDATGKVASLQDIAKVYIRTQRYKEAKEILDECLEIAKKTKNREQESNIYEFYTELYEKQNKVNEAYEYYKKRQAIKDSVFSNQRMLQISQMRVRYDLNEKEIENELLKDKLSKEKLIRLIGLAFSMFVLLAGIWIFRNSQKIDKFSKEVAKKNEEIKATLESLEQANQAISIKNEEIEKRSQEIELKNEDLIQSIGYALLIQEAMLPNKNVLDNLLKEYFVIWEPKDIVSGDFYWVADKPDKIILVIADCTGHGVPGAMMSMLGNNLLNSIIHDLEIYEPHLILEKMHQDVIESLRKTDSHISDSMEMAIVSIDKNKPVLDYAGAGISLYYNEDNTLKIIEADKTSIGNTYNGTEIFHLHTLEINITTYFYLSTDGYKDQFGGEQNKKIGSKQFRRMLEEITNMPMKEQKEVLLRKLYLWQKAAQESQTDDITVLSFRIEV